MDKNTKRYTIIDSLTGEVVHALTPEELAELREQDNHKPQTEFFMTFAGMKEMVNDKRLNATDWRVYTCLCLNMTSGGWCALTQDAIAAGLGMIRTNVNPSMKKLEELGYISRERHPTTKRLTIRLDAAIVGRGATARKRAERALVRKLKKAEGEILPAGELTQC
jgi:DNA-binding transcriptional regulator GbsR (MarR family)